MTKRTTKIDVSPDLTAALEASARQFRARYGREPGESDPLLFDEASAVPTAMTEEQLVRKMTAAMITAGTPERA
jgi:hypothetical protein